MTDMFDTALNYGGLIVCNLCRKRVSQKRSGEHGEGICIPMKFPSERTRQDKILATSGDCEAEVIVQELLLAFAEEGVQSDDHLKSAQVLATLAVAEALGDIASALKDANKI